MTPNMFLAGLIAALTGTSPHPVHPAQQPQPHKPRLEAIYSFGVTRAGLNVVVPSNGCTRKDDFAPRTSGPGHNAVIGFYRKRPDTCRSLVAGHAELRYTFAELALSPNVHLKVLNELTADPSPLSR